MRVVSKRDLKKFESPSFKLLIMTEAENESTGPNSASSIQLYTRGQKEGQSPVPVVQHQHTYQTQNWLSNFQSISIEWKYIRWCMKWFNVFPKLSPRLKKRKLVQCDVHFQMGMSVWGIPSDYKPRNDSMHGLIALTLNSPFWIFLDFSDSDKHLSWEGNCSIHLG